MKKVSIITILDNINFGTYLQAVATATLVKQRGFNAELVNYVRRENWATVYLFNTVRSTKNPLKILVRLIRAFKWLNLRNKDWKFVEKYVPLTKRYNSFKDLVKDPPAADIYMTGSDQVWNSLYNKGVDKAFYCDYAQDDKNIVAFSASIGMEDFPEEEKAETLKLLKRYSTITVREKSAKFILEKLGLENISVTLDPTFLLSKSDWDKLIPNNVYETSENYVLLYSVEGELQNRIIEKIAKSVADTKGYKIYAISCGRSSYTNVDKKFEYVTPDLFISLVRQSKYMIVSSFHGTAYSINFNKQFITVTPRKFNSRINSILELCDLKQYNISTINDAIPDEPIDYERVNKVIDNMRIKSNELLDRMLSYTDN